MIAFSFFIIIALLLGECTSKTNTERTKGYTNRRNLCFGWNQYGICAVGDVQPHTEPTEMGKGDSFKLLKNFSPYIFTLSGYRHSFLKTSDGIYGYGSNYNCMLGFEEDHSMYPNPTKLNQFPDDEEIEKLSSNYVHSIALTKNGSIYTWGDNSYGQLGTGELGFSCKPNKVTKAGEKGRDISTGNCHTLLAYEDGSLRGMGCNDHYQLGIEDRKPTVLNVTKLPINESVVMVSAGSSFSVILTDTKSVWFMGQILCDDGNVSEQVKKPRKFFDSASEEWKGGFKDIHSGFNHFVAVHVNGSTLAGYGCNDYNSLGIGAPVLKPFAMDTSPLYDSDDDNSGYGKIKKKNIDIVKAVAMNRNTMVLLNESGELFYVGQNMSLPLFDNRNSTYDVLTRMLSPERIIDMDASIYHLTAISESNVYCWGENTFYQCGNTIESWFGEFKIPSSNEFIVNQISDICVNPQHGIAITDEGKVFTFGIGTLGQLGFGSYDNQFFPVDVKLDSGIRIIGGDAALRATVILDENGTLYTFGSGDGGLLGTGSLETENTPQMIPRETFDGKTIVDVRATDVAMIALTEEGKIYVWGESNQGELGLGVLFRYVKVPELLSIVEESSEEYIIDDGIIITDVAKTPKKVKQIAAGVQGMMALTECNEVWEWGRVASDPKFEIHYSPHKSFQPKEGEQVDFVQAGRSWNIIVVDGFKLYLKGVIGTLTLKKPLYHLEYIQFWEAPVGRRIIQCYSEYHSVCILDDGSVYGFGNNNWNQLTLNNKTTGIDIPFQMNFTRLGVNDWDMGIKFSKTRLASFTTVLQEAIFCHGLMDSEPGVCGSHGVCVSNDECSCYFGFGGENCTLFTCNSITSDNSSVCSGHGQCVGRDKCNCTSLKWNSYNPKNPTNNLYCDHPICLTSHPGKICSGQGKCDVDHSSNEPMCICDEKWRGKKCDLPVCNNFTLENENPSKTGCGVWGKCVDFNHCDCDISGLNVLFPLQTDKDVGCVASPWKIVIMVFIVLGIISIISCCCVLCLCCCCGIGLLTRLNLESTKNIKLLKEKNEKNKEKERKEGFNMINRARTSIFFGDKRGISSSIDDSDNLFPATQSMDQSEYGSLGISNVVNSSNKKKKKRKNNNIKRTDSDISVDSVKRKRRSYQAISSTANADTVPLLGLGDGDLLSDKRISDKNYHSLPGPEDKIPSGYFIDENNESCDDDNNNINRHSSSSEGGDDYDEDDDIFDVHLLENQEEVRIGECHFFKGNLNGIGTIFYFEKSEVLVKKTSLSGGLIADLPPRNNSPSSSSLKSVLYPIFRGNFIQGKREGFGRIYRKHYYPETDLPKGFYLDPRFIRFEGQFHNDMKHGRGKEYDDNGRLVRVCQWNEDICYRVQDLNVSIREISLDEIKDLRLIHSGWDSHVFTGKLGDNNDNKTVAVKIYKRIRDQEEEGEEEEEEEEKRVMDRSLMNYSLEVSRSGDIISMLKIISIFPHTNIIKIIGYSGENFHYNNSDSSPSKFFYIMENCEMSVYDRVLYSLECPPPPPPTTKERRNRRVDQKEMMKSLSVQDKKKILYQIALGMEHLHDICGLIHRDLKLSNIMISHLEFLEVKIADLDMADRDSIGIYGVKSKNMPAGSPFHIAPECVVLHQFDSKCDVYSFAILMYELLFEKIIDPFNILKSISSRRKKRKEEKNRLSQRELGNLMFSEMKKYHKLGVKPHIPKDTRRFVDDEKWLIQLMRRCWSSTSSQRPKFSEIVLMFKNN